MVGSIGSALRTRRGAVALIIALTFTLVSMFSAGARTLLLIPVWIVIGWLIAWVWERSAERRPGPKPSPFTRQQSSSGMRTMLRQDRNAHFVIDTRGFLSRKRIWFEATGCPPLRVPGHEFERLTRDHLEGPVHVTSSAERQYWWWENAFYWENEGYSASDVKALVTRSRRQKERSLQHAHALLDGETSRKRDPIPEDVRRQVWRRDGGRCQECGASEILQFDHMIPWSLGGADTVDNLRLLCADCNRLKSDTI